MLFQMDLNPDVDPRDVREMIRERLSSESLEDFAWSLFVGVMESRTEIDASIAAIADNWALNRMASTARNTLRLGTFELLHTTTPPRVGIDESIELAKRFGTAQSAQFVNGVLDQLVPSGDDSAPTRTL